MNANLLNVLFIITAIILINMATYGLKKQKLPGAFSFSLLLICMAIHSFGYAFEVLSTSHISMSLWLKFKYVGISFYPILIILFSREFTSEKKFANQYVVNIVGIFNFVTFIIMLSNPIHSIFFMNEEVVIYKGLTLLKYDIGPWQYVHILLLLVAVVYSFVTFWIKAHHSTGEYKTRLHIMMIGISMPLTLTFIFIFNVLPNYFDMFPFVYMLMSLFIAYGLFKYNLLYLTPVTHEMVFNSINESVIVTNYSGDIISFNASSKKLFKSLNNMSYGDSIKNIPELSSYDFLIEKNIHYYDYSTYEIKIFYLDNTKGKIYVITDITEREEAKKQLEILATTDKLTGLYNRWYFMNQVENSDFRGAFVIIDIDHFKRVNDQYGHHAGDKVLSFFGKELMNHFTDNIVCRYGGEEFAIFMQNHTVESAYDKVNTFRAKMSSEYNDLNFTFSAGISAYDPITRSNAVILADQKLYEAKHNGRNQVRY